MDQLKIDVLPDSNPNVHVLKLSGPFLMANVFEFQALVRDHPRPTTIVDLSNVPYMDSAALGAVVGLHISSQRLRHKYALVGPSERLMTMFDHGGVRDLLAIFPTTEAALNALR